MPLLADTMQDERAVFKQKFTRAHHVEFYSGEAKHGTEHSREANLSSVYLWSTYALGPVRDSDTDPGAVQDIAPDAERLQSARCSKGQCSWLVLYCA